MISLYGVFQLSLYLLDFLHELVVFCLGALWIASYLLVENGSISITVCSVHDAPSNEHCKRFRDRIGLADTQNLRVLSVLNVLLK